MKDDILTVMWMELKGIFRYQGSMRTVLLNLFIPLVMFGMVIPYQEGVEWVDSFLIIIVVGFVPVLSVGLRIPDSVAGERERHTLGTLLASRLPDRAILIGKMLVGILYGWILTLIVLLISIIVVNVTNWTGEIVFFPPHVAISSVVGSLFLAIMIACLGVIISMRAETVQKATQTLVFTFLVIPIIIQVGAVFVLQSDDARETIGRVIDSVTSPEFMASVIGIILVIDLILLFLVDTRFKRSRLLLI
jgi:ABC-2 type transport system permease protein